MPKAKSSVPTSINILKGMFRDAPEYLVVLDADLNVTMAGSRFQKATGIKKNSQVSFLDTVDRFSRSKVENAIQGLKDAKDPHCVLDINHQGPKDSVTVQYSWTCYRDDSGTCQAFIGIGRPKPAAKSESGEKVNEELEFVTAQLERRTRELTRLKKKMEDRAERDDMTGLGNRRYLMERLEVEAARAARYDQPLTLILFDIDRMAHVNDVYGQEKGDEVIQAMSLVIQEQIRQSDLAGRYAGEEFLILCPHTDRANAQFLAERLRRRVAELSFEGKDEEFGITISVGLVTITGQNEFDVEAIIQAAEQALESAKTGGMNRVRILEVI